MNAWGLPPLQDVVGVDDLELALREAAQPLTAREIRNALDIDRAYLSVEVSRFLHVAVDSGRVVRHGNAVGTRYQAA